MLSERQSVSVLKWIVTYIFVFKDRNMKRSKRSTGSSEVEAKSASKSRSDAKAKSASSKKSSKSLTPLAVLSSSFYAIPLVKTSLLNPSQSFVKHLYVKARQVDEIATLIVSNISVEDTEESLKRLFERLSGLQVSSIEIGKDRLAVIRFEGVPDLEDAFLKRISREDCLTLELEDKGEIQQSCIDKWMAQYRNSRPDRAIIGREADERIAELDRLEKERIEKSRQPQVDEDGFTLVVSTSKKRAKPASNNQEGARERKEPERKRKRLMDEKLSFYKFEKRRLRNQELAKLKAQMKNDLKRVDRLKSEMANATV